jgi:hypothetical protein
MRRFTYWPTALVHGL